MQPNAELLKYIQEQTGQGWSIDQILPELHSFGWPDEEIKVALEWLAASASNANQPEQEYELPATSNTTIMATQIPTSEFADPLLSSSASPSAAALRPPESTTLSQQQASPLEVSASNFSIDPQMPQMPPMLNNSTAPVPTQMQSSNMAQTIGFSSTDQEARIALTPQASYTTDPAIQAPQLTQSQPPLEVQPQFQQFATQAQAVTQPAQPAPQAQSPSQLQNQVPPQLLQPLAAPVIQPQNTSLTASTQGIIPVQTTVPTTTSNPAIGQSLTGVSQVPGGALHIFGRFKKQLAILFIAVALGGAIALVLSVFNETPQDGFRKTVQKSLLTSTYQRDYSTSTLSEGLQLKAVIKSDFSDTTHPKSSADIQATLEFGPESTISARYELIAVDDTIWLRPTSIETNLDQATRATYQDLSRGGDVDTVISSLVGAGTLNQWEEHVYNPSLVTSYGLTYNLIRFGFAMNSPLSGFPIANANKHNATAVNLVIGSGMIQVDYNKVENEKIDSKNYKVYNATFNARSFSDTGKNLAELLDLSQRHRDALSEKDIKVEDGEFKLWVDPSTHLPYQLKAPRDGVEIKYSNFGNNFDIKSPL